MKQLLLQVKGAAGHGKSNIVCALQNDPDFVKHDMFVLMIFDVFSGLLEKKKVISPVCLQAIARGLVRYGYYMTIYKMCLTFLGVTLFILIN